MICGMRVAFSSDPRAHSKFWARIRKWLVRIWRSNWGTTSFGRLWAGGGLHRANLAGDLTLAQVDGYGANLGHQFEIMTYATLNGDFDVTKGLLLNRVPVLSAVVNANRVIANGTADVTDLAVDSITIPAQASAGDQITVSYTVDNLTELSRGR